MFRDFSFRDFLKIFWARVVILFSKASARGGHLYSKVDIMLEYKNTEKGSFFTERQVPRGPCLGCQKQQKLRKRVCFLRLNKNYVLRVYFLLTMQYVIRVMLVCSRTFPS